jgi:hypothetical protein
VPNIWRIIGMPQPGGGGGRGRGGGGGGFGGGGATMVGTGDYVVTLTVGGQTYKQTFRVERVSGGGDVTLDFGNESDDGVARAARSRNR